MQQIVLQTLAQLFPGMQGFIGGGDKQDTEKQGTSVLLPPTPSSIIGESQMW